ncbi:DNA binding domain-containing protein, excisionase family [Austwickia chelonae]|uniref:Helix-turn-helix domain-containing protein n=2 Tax=Austwickia TaxID=1184606 RepID=K6UNR6_9MICO|nr:hypothetical protein AUCHE_21_00160 [Austwickia chelonae NBRC 105200]SEW37086.1 DNA binding domain-containing protein, excisionase family [Austwickia chelonae]
MGPSHPDVLLSSRALDEARNLNKSLDTGHQMASLPRPDGAPQPLPSALDHVLRQAIRILASGQTVTVGSRPATLTTTAAAAALGVSRPTLMKMIRKGEIPAHKVGSHTRLRTDDVDEARRRRRADQRAAFDALRELEAADDV